MSNSKRDPLHQLHVACDSLLHELQVIWNEVGESEIDRDNALKELEQECLEVCRRKVDQANQNRAKLRQEIAQCEAELAAICSAMGELPVHTRQVDQNETSLKEELERILPQLEEMRKRKLERRTQFIEVCEEIEQINNEIHGSADPKYVYETDMSLRKLEELHGELQSLQKEKSERLRQIQEYIDSLNFLCSVLGMDIDQVLGKIHSGLGSLKGDHIDITHETIQKLSGAINNLREIKLQRMAKLQDLAASMLELWNLMDTPIEEQQLFQYVTCKIAATEEEITDTNSLSIDLINHVEAEVSRLERLKSSKMKELVLKKKSELEELCRKIHLIPEANTTLDDAIDAIDSGTMDAENILDQLELQIVNVKEEAFVRKDLLEKVDKWLTARDEESWLEEYNRDENRFNAGRGAHLILKRAEKARSLVNKLPGMVEGLISKTISWEAERGIEFSYDGIRLLSMLEEYTLLRQEKEEEKRRQRDQKKLQGLLITEQETLYGSKPSPSKVQSVKKAPRASTGGVSNRRLSLGGTMIQTPKATPRAKKITDKISQLNYLNDDGYSTLSDGRRGLGGLPAKQQHSYGGCTNYLEPEAPLLRKPFSPISSKANIMDQHTEAPNGILKKSHQSFSTPCKVSTAGDEENKTPKAVPISASTTPFTVAVPMQTTMTPCQPLPVPSAGRLAELEQDEIEYSFEEIRAGFVLSTRPVRSIHV